MRAHQEAIRTNAASLRHEIDLGLSMQDQLARSGVSSSLVLARRQAYVSGLISIYALLEQTIDNVLTATVESWSSIFERHADINDVVRSNMRQLTLQALLDADQGRSRITIDETRAVASIQVSPGAHPTFEPGVATRKTANYRHPLVMQMLKRIGIDGEDVFDEASLSAHLAITGFSQIGSFLEDLTERRNEMSHRMISPDAGILHRDALVAYLDLVTAYLLEVVRVVSLCLIQLAKPRLTSIGQCREARDRHLSFDLDAGSLAVGDHLLFIKGGQSSVQSVASLQLNKNPLRNIRVKSAGVDIGISLVGGQNRRYRGSAVYLIPNSFVSVMKELSVGVI